MEKICKNCSSWKNQQAELEYSNFSGICTSAHLKFTTTNYSRVSVLDRDCRTTKHKGTASFENQKDEVPFGEVEKSRYCLVTEEEFGCKHFKPKK